MRKNSEKKLKVNIWTFFFAGIGFAVSWFNMIFILDAPRTIEVLAFLSIILTTMIPGVVIALINRFGGYTFATTIFIFIILWLIFWKAWRSLSSIKTGDKKEIP